MQITSIPSLILILLFASQQLACTSSGGDDSPADEGEAKISGVVNKGIISNGVVSAFAISNGIPAKTALVSTSTDSNGDYELNLGSYTGPVLLTVSPKTDGSSRMICDSPSGCDANNDGSPETLFGQSVQLKFTLEAVINTSSPGTITSAAITPLSSMAASYARKVGLGSTGIQLANQKVATLFGLNSILNVKPVNIADSNALDNEANTDNIKAALIAASVAELAATKAIPIADIIDTLASNYSDNDGELVNRESVDSSSVISLEELTQAAQAVATSTSSTNTNVTTANTELGVIKTTASGSTADSTSTTIVTIADDDLTIAKALINDFKSWQSLLDGINTFSTRSNAPSNTATISADPFSLTFSDYRYSADDVSLNIIRRMVQAYHDVVNSNKTSPVPLSDYDSSYTSPTITSSGSIIVDLVAKTVSVAGATMTDFSGIINTINLTLLMPDQANSASSFTVSVDNSVTATIDNPGALFNFNPPTPGATSLTYTFPSAVNFYNAAMDKEDAAKITVQYDYSITQQANTPIDVAVSNPVSDRYTGTISNLDLDMLTPVGSVSNLKEGDDRSWRYTTSNNQFIFDDGYGAIVDVSLDTTMSNGGTFAPDTATADLPALMTTITNAGAYSFSADGTKLIVTVGNMTWTYRLDLSDPNWAYIYAVEENPDNFSNFLSNSINEYQVYSVNPAPAPGTSLYDFLITEGFDLIASTSWEVLGEGYYRGQLPPGISNAQQAGGSFDAYLESHDGIGESKTNYRAISGNLNVTADLIASDTTALPTIIANASAARTAYFAGSATGSVSYSGLTLSAQAYADLAWGIEFKVNISRDSDGKIITLMPDLFTLGITGRLFIGNNVVGTYQIGSNSNAQDAIMIRYTDASRDEILLQ